MVKITISRFIQKYPGVCKNGCISLSSEPFYLVFVSKIDQYTLKALGLDNFKKDFYCLMSDVSKTSCSVCSYYKDCLYYLQECREEKLKRILNEKEKN